MAAERAIWVRCANCAFTGERTIDADEWQRTADGEVLPLRCDACWVTALVLTVRPWVLTENDRDELRWLRIVQE